MKAVRIFEHGDIDKLIIDDIPEPVCPADRVKIQIKAAALNHLDIWVRNGLPGIPVPLPLILGSDGSGIIIEAGSDVENWSAGDEIVIQPGIFCGQCDDCRNGKENYCLQYGILGETEDGVLSEYIIVDSRNISSKAPHLTFEEAASMQLVFMTAYQMLVNRADLKTGESVLVYGGTSGVGSAAIQISKDIGARTITTVGNKEKYEHAQKMGADFVVNHSHKDWLNEVKEIVKGEGVDVVFEHIGSATWNQSLRLLAKGGRIVTCGATTGHQVAINLNHLFIKQQSILGSTMSNISAFQQVQEKILKKYFFPFVNKVFLMEDIRSAHEHIENRKQMGKVVIVP